MVQSEKGLVILAEYDAMIAPKTARLYAGVETERTWSQSRESTTHVHKNCGISVCNRLLFGDNTAACEASATTFMVHVGILLYNRMVLIALDSIPGVTDPVQETTIR